MSAFERSSHDAREQRGAAHKKRDEEWPKNDTARPKGAKASDDGESEEGWMSVPNVLFVLCTVVGGVGLVRSRGEKTEAQHRKSTYDTT